MANDTTTTSGKTPGGAPSKTAAKVRAIPPTIIAIGHLAYASAMRVQVTRMAAALAFRTVFSIIPVLVLGLVLLGATTSENQVRDAVTQVLKFTGLNKISLDTWNSTQKYRAGQTVGYHGKLYEALSENAGSPPDRTPLVWRESHPVVDLGEDKPGATPPSAATTPPDGAPAPPAAGENADDGSLETWVRRLAESVRHINFTALGWIGFLSLLYATVSIMIEMELAFNHIYRAPGGRGWPQRLTQYFTTITLGPIFLIGSFYVSFDIATKLRNVTEGVTSGRTNLDWLVPILTTVPISTMLFFVLFMTVPNTKVRWWPALNGAVFSAVLWELGKWGFSQFVVSSTFGGAGGYTKFYGSLALIPLLLLWIYYTWLIVLLGLQLSASMQMFRHVREQGRSFFDRLLNPDAPAEPTMVDVSLSLPMMVVIAERFRDGQRCEARKLAAEFGITEPVALTLLSRLTSAGLLNRVATGNEDRVFTLARPAEDIRAAEVLRAAEAAGEISGPTPHAEVLEAIAGQRLRFLEGKSLADYCRTPKPAAATDTAGPVGAPAIAPT